MIRLLLIVAMLLALSPWSLAQGVTPTLPSPPNSHVGSVLTGTVVNQNHDPIFHARITIDGSQWTSTGTDGTFRIDAIPAGNHDVKITARNHHTGEKVVEFRDGQQKTMMVMLTAIDLPPAPPKQKVGTFYVQAYPYQSGNKKYFVKHVEVYQYGDPSRTWSQYKYNGSDGTGIYLPCEGAIVGKHYTINITWRSMPNADGIDEDDELNGSWYKQFDSEWETHTFYNPW